MISLIRCHCHVLNRFCDLSLRQHVVSSKKGLEVRVSERTHTHLTSTPPTLPQFSRESHQDAIDESLDHSSRLNPARCYSDTELRGHSRTSPAVHADYDLQGFTSGPPSRAALPLTWTHEIEIQRYALDSFNFFATHCCSPTGALGIYLHVFPPLPLRPVIFSSPLSVMWPRMTAQPSNFSGNFPKDSIQPKDRGPTSWMDSYEYVRRSIGGLNRARKLFDSLVKSNSKHLPGWIAAACLEEHAGHMVAARKIIKMGCGQCPKSEDVWLEAARLHLLNIYPTQSAYEKGTVNLESSITDAFAFFLLVPSKSSPCRSNFGLPFGTSRPRPTEESRGLALTMMDDGEADHSHYPMMMDDGEVDHSHYPLLEPTPTNSWVNDTTPGCKTGTLAVIQPLGEQTVNMEKGVDVYTDIGARGDCKRFPVAKATTLIRP
ncbi:hypothetical protein FPV67DRAFT_1453789 [Lyophyllum atratum]|nr:hypothetical protein FPV67DRAFT_1453789 [Lyophyllum atratum]